MQEHQKKRQSEYFPRRIMTNKRDNGSKRSLKFKIDESIEKIKMKSVERASQNCLQKKEVSKHHKQVSKSKKGEIFVQFTKNLKKHRSKQVKMNFHSIDKSQSRSKEYSKEVLGINKKRDIIKGSDNSVNQQQKTSILKKKQFHIQQLFRIPTKGKDETKRDSTQDFQCKKKLSTNTSEKLFSNEKFPFTSDYIDYDRKKKPNPLYFINDSIQRQNVSGLAIEKYQQSKSCCLLNTINNYLLQIECFLKLAEDCANVPSYNPFLDSEWYYREFFRKRTKLEKILIRLCQSSHNSKHLRNVEILKDRIKSLIEENRDIDHNLIKQLKKQTKIERAEGHKKTEVIRLLEKEIAQIKNLRKQDQKSMSKIRNLYTCIEVVNSIREGKLLKYLEDMFF